MIGRLKGTVEEIYAEHVIIDVNGIGYVVFASSKTLQALTHSESVTLSIETVVKEDSITLFGFLTDEEKSLFNTLRTVQGVGAKMALAILSTFSPLELQQAISSGDKKMLTRASGVGPKLATRIITELENKLSAPALSTHITPNATSGAMEHAISALVNLGFSRSHVHPLISELVQEGITDMETLIREGLKKL